MGIQQGGRSATVSNCTSRKREEDCRSVERIADSPRHRCATARMCFSASERHRLAKSTAKHNDHRRGTRAGSPPRSSEQHSDETSNPATVAIASTTARGCSASSPPPETVPAAGVSGENGMDAPRVRSSCASLLMLLIVKRSTHLHMYMMRNKPSRAIHPSAIHFHIATHQIWDCKCV